MNIPPHRVHAVAEVPEAKAYSLFKTSTDPKGPWNILPHDSISLAMDHAAKMSKGNKPAWAVTQLPHEAFQGNVVAFKLHQPPKKSLIA